MDESEVCLLFRWAPPEHATGIPLVFGVTTCGHFVLWTDVPVQQEVEGAMVASPRCVLFISRSSGGKTVTYCAGTLRWSAWARGTASATSCTMAGCASVCSYNTPTTSNELRIYSRKPTGPVSCTLPDFRPPCAPQWTSRASTTTIGGWTILCGRWRHLLRMRLRLARRCKLPRRCSI